MTIKNIPLVSKRILKAVLNGENIVLYGDADLDGVSSVIILKELIEILVSEYSRKSGIKITVYFPDREREGYGINEKALENLKSEAPALLISLDCGIGNAKEVEIAKKMGFEVIIIDHHKVLPEVPKASIIVDPEQPGDPYPFKSLAAVGVTYRLIEYTLSNLKYMYPPERFLDLVMLATLADQVPLKDENKKLVMDGILVLRYTKRPGIKALMELTGFPKNGGIDDVQQKIIFPLNRAALIGHLHEAYLLLTETSLAKAKEFSKELLRRSMRRKQEVQDAYNEVEDRIKEGKDSDIIFEGNRSWSLFLLGTVASKLCHKYKKPTFLFKILGKESVGTIRMPSGGDAVKAMIVCNSLLKTYGGHPLAAGFRIKNENLDEFKDCLEKYFKSVK